MSSAICYVDSINNIASIPQVIKGQRHFSDEELPAMTIGHQSNLTGRVACNCHPQ
jgi:hypothetical protein